MAWERSYDEDVVVVVGGCGGGGGSGDGRLPYSIAVSGKIIFFIIYITSRHITIFIHNTLHLTCKAKLTYHYYYC